MNLQKTSNILNINYIQNYYLLIFLEINNL